MALANSPARCAKMGVQMWKVLAQPMAYMEAHDWLSRGMWEEEGALYQYVGECIPYMYKI